MSADSEDYRYPSLVDMDSETHGGDDVMVFARGPWAHLFTGNYEQNAIPVAMARAAGISTDPPAAGGATSSGSRVVGPPFDVLGRTALVACVAALLSAGDAAVFGSGC